MAKTSRLRDQLYMLQGSRCFYCDRPIAHQDRSLEHIIADSIGGFANEENAVVVCHEVNQLLGDASPKRKMMMLKSGGGKIECPRAAQCPKPQPEQTAVAKQILPEPNGGNKKAPKAPVQKQDSGKAKKKQRSRTKTAPAVH